MSPSTEQLPQNLDAASLAQAFEAFARASDELTEAYNGLQKQVGTLTERLSVLMAALPAGVVVLNQEGSVEQINQAASNMFGLQENESLLGQPWLEIFTQHFTQTESPVEWNLIRNGKEHLRIALSESAVESSGGRLVLMHDQTEAYQMRVAANRNERLAAMGEMVAGLAHQLRTPLAAALLYTGHLANPAMAMMGGQEEIAEKAVERLRHLEKLIQNMLIFARGEAIGRESFPICALVDEIAQTIEPVAQRKGVRFAKDCQCGEILMFGNRKEIAGALINLLENALQAFDSANGEVMLVAEIYEQQACFRVRDNGRGIAPEVQKRLFDPFFTTRAEGTGLGLAIARGVARAHAGDISLKSELGHGSEFTFAIPLTHASSFSTSN